jgi:hypothetical protein
MCMKDSEIRSKATTTTNTTNSHMNNSHGNGSGVNSNVSNIIVGISSINSSGIHDTIRHPNRDLYQLQQEQEQQQQQQRRDDDDDSHHERNDVRTVRSSSSVPTVNNTITTSTTTLPPQQQQKQRPISTVFHKRTPPRRTSSSTSSIHSSNNNSNTGNVTTTSRLQETSLQITAGTIVAVTVAWFSLYFPFVLAPAAAVPTYILAQWEYDSSVSYFDNTIWTYGTDYFLAVCMLLLIGTIPCRVSSSFYRTGYYTRGLLASYMLSVAAGGLAHQFYTTVASQNTIQFRLLWTVCVGAVAIASGFMGAAATSLSCLDHPHDSCNVRCVVLLPKRTMCDQPTEEHGTVWKFPIIPEAFWFAYAIGVVAIVIAGGFSFQRPACDIFVVGITQCPSTLYMMLLLYKGISSQKYTTMCYGMRMMGCFGFILNAPLLPLYPILVQYTDWSLGAINTFLHTWLLVAWTCQGLALRHAGSAVVCSEMVQVDIR